LPRTWDKALRERILAQRCDFAERGLETRQVLAETEFDELVVGQWLHIEQMDSGFWWMNIGGVTVHVKADRDGKPRKVTVSSPWDYDEPREGVTYECVWSGDD
jgi:hypothetical protein